MLYIQLAILAAAFALGLGSGWKSQEATVQALKAGIAQANTEAALQLQVAETKTATADRQALDLKQELEHAHDSYIRTAGAYSDLTARLRGATGCQSRQDAVPTTTNTGISAATTARPDISAAIAGLVADADAVAEYATQCHKFVSNHCGIMP